MSRTFHHSRNWGKEHFYQISTAVGPEPNWFSHMFSIRPQRNRDTRLLARVRADTVDADNVCFSTGTRRPHAYYW